MGSLYNWPEETEEFKEKIVAFYSEHGRSNLAVHFKDVFHKKTGEPVSSNRVYFHYYTKCWFKDIHRGFPLFPKATPDFKEKLIQAYKLRGEECLMNIFKDFKHPISGNWVIFSDVIRRYPFLKSEFPDIVSIHKNSLRKYKWPVVTPELEKRLIEHYISVGIMGLHNFVSQAFVGHSLSDDQKDSKTYHYYCRKIKFPYKNNRGMGYSQRNYPMLTPRFVKKIQKHFLDKGREGISELLGLPVSKANDIRVYNYLWYKRVLPKVPKNRQRAQYDWPDVTQAFKDKVKKLYLKKGRKAAMLFLRNIEFSDGKKATYACIYEHYKRLGIIPLKSLE
jgi:hypothetical protein